MTLTAKYDPASPSTGSAYEQAHPFVVENKRLTFRLTREEASRLWCDLEIALNTQDNTQQRNT